MTFEAPQRRNRGFSLPATTPRSPRLACGSRQLDPDTDPDAAILLRIDPPRRGPDDSPPLAALRPAALGSSA